MLSLETTPTIDQIKNAAKRYAIIGVGNLLQRDDGVGVHAVRALQPLLKSYSNVSCIDAGTLSYELLEWVASSDHTIVIDAAYMRCSPGTVRVFEDEAIADQFKQATTHSVHQITVRVSC
ncbi:MAG TPA: peptidase, partial [Alteromonas macleodii]|nr:peptidase [Alteromonas macleodii]